MDMPLKFRLLPERFAVHRLAPRQAIDSKALLCASWISITRTEDELSIVAPEALDLGESVREAGWSCFKIDQTLDFSLIGVLASVATVLAEAKVSIFAVSTFETDYVLVRSHDVDRAVQALRGAGHRVALPRDGAGLRPVGSCNGASVP